MDLTKHTDAELIVEFRNQIRKEDEIYVSSLEYISEIQTRRLFLKYNFRSNFEFLTKHFRFSNATAQRRIDVAWLVTEFPHIKDRLLNKEYIPTQLASFVRAVRQKEKTAPVSLELKAEILDLITNKSLQESDMIISRALGIEAIVEESHRRQADGSLKIQCRLTAEQEQLFKLVKEKMSHVNPNPSFVDTFEYLAKLFVKEPAPRKSKPSQNEGYVPKQVQREVLKKHDGCQWVDPLTGRKCGSRFQMQIDHIQPLWAGGTSEIENLQILCRHHNLMKYEIEMQMYQGLHPIV